MIAFIGIALTGAGFLAVVAWETHEAAAMRLRGYALAAGQREGHVQRELKRTVDVSLDLAAFLRVNGSPDKLRDYAVYVLSHEPIAQVLAWLPRLGMEQPLDHWPADKPVTVRQPDGEQVAVEHNANRFPADYLYSAAPAAPASGEDLFADPLYREAMERARDSGYPAISALVPPYGPGLPGYDVALFIPVYPHGVPATVSLRRERLTGFLMVGLRLDKLIARTIEGTEPNGVRLWLVDQTVSKEPTVLYRPYGMANSVLKAVADARGASAGFDAGGRHWAVFATPTNPVSTPASPVNRWLVLGAGVLLTSLLLWYMVVLRRQASALGHANAALTREVADRRRAEMALRHSEARFRKVLETAADAILIIDSNSRIVIANREAERLFGYGRGALLGREIHELVPSSLQAVHRQHERDYFADPDRIAMAEGRELMMRRRDGSGLPVEINLSPLRAPDGIYVTAIVRDVSERKRNEERIRWLASFPADSPNPVLRLSGEGFLVYANDSAQPLLEKWRCSLGQQLPEHLHRCFTEIVAGAGKQEVEERVADRLFLLCFSLVGDSTGVNLYGLDITERRQAEAQGEKAVPA